MHRNNKPIAEIDVYDLLINGTANLDLQLQDQDVLLVSPFQSRVKVNGEVKRPMTFEIGTGDTFENLLSYAGGFTDLAFKDRVAISRITGNQCPQSVRPLACFERDTVSSIPGT